MSEILSERKVKIRKPHNCWGCTKEFHPPAKMQVVTSVDNCDKSFSTIYWCKKCQDRYAEMDYEGIVELYYGELLQNWSEALNGK